MSSLVILGIVLAVINPVIGGVLVGYIVWLRDQYIGFQLIFLSLTVMQLFLIGFIVYAVKKIRKLEKLITEANDKKTDT